VSDSKKNHVDLGVKLPMRRNKVTTAIEVGLIREGIELNVPGYRRHQLHHMRPLFKPSTGEMIFELQGLHFGEVARDELPLTVDAIALYARNAVFYMRAFKGTLIRPKLEIIRLPWMGVTVVQA